MNIKRIVGSSLIGALAVAIVISTGIFYRKNTSLPVEAADSVTVYDYYSNTDSGLVAKVSKTANWVLSDINAPSYSFTLNVGSNNYNGGVNTVLLGDTSGDVLSGASPKQFVYGTPSLKALAESSNLVSIKRLYGFRSNADLDLTNFKNVIVRVGWTSNASMSASGFLATSTTGNSESWTRITPAKQAIIFTKDAANYIEFTDTNNNILMGKSAVRLAFIFGSNTSAQAARNIYIKVTGVYRTELSSLTNHVFDHIVAYIKNETFDPSKFSFHANYLYPTSSQHILGNANGVSLAFSPALVDNKFTSVGEYTLTYQYTDPNGYGIKSNSALVEVTADSRTLTGIKVADFNSRTYDKYALYNPNFVVYPLFNNATEPNTSIDSPLNEDLYTLAVSKGTMLTDNGIDTIALKENSSIKASLSYSVTPRNPVSISLSGMKTSFFKGEAFSASTLIVTASFSSGGTTQPQFASSQTDGKYTISLAPSTTLDTIGTQTITISYYASSMTIINSYEITVELEIYTFFNHAFSDGGEWGATSTAVDAKITNRLGNLSNSVVGYTAETSWVLNTTLPSSPAAGDGAFVITPDGSGGVGLLRFGTETRGPAKVSWELATFPAITNPQNTVNGISRITIDAETGSEGSLTVSVAGISPTSYAINYGAHIDGSAAPTAAGAGTYRSYTFYFPYTVIGKIKVSFTNNASAPKYFDVGNFSIVGYRLSVEEQAGVFANMLDHGNSCSQDTYNNLLVVYNYLNSPTVNASQYLSNYVMENHGSPAPTAAELWAIMEGRNNQGNILQTKNYLSDEKSNEIIIYSVALLALFITLSSFYYYKNRKVRKNKN